MLGNASGRLELRGNMSHLPAYSRSCLLARARYLGLSHIHRYILTTNSITPLLTGNLSIYISRNLYTATSFIYISAETYCRKPSAHPRVSLCRITEEYSLQLQVLWEQLDLGNSIRRNSIGCTWVGKQLLSDSVYPDRCPHVMRYHYCEYTILIR